MIKRFLESKKLTILALICLCALSYFDILNHGFMIDDVQFLAPEQFLPSLSLSYYLFHTPSMHFSPGYYIVNLAAFDLLNSEPFALHAINIVLHAINAALFYYFLCLISTRNGINAFAAAIFALLPVNSFTIAYIPANTIFLSSIWTLLSMVFFCLYSRKNRKAWLMGSYAAFFLGLLHFEGALLIPLYVAGIMWLIERRNFKSMLMHLLPFALLSVGYLMIWFITAGPNAPIADKLAVNNIGWLDYGFAYGRLIGWYVGKLIYPEGVVYIYNVTMDPGKAALVFLVGTMAAFVGCLWSCLKHRNIISFSLLWLISGFLLVFPAIATHYNAMGFVIEPHWLYFNSMGFCLLLAIALSSCRAYLGPQTLSLIAVCLLLYFFIMTKYTNALSQNEERYYEYWLRVSPGNAIARENLASLYIWDETISVEPDLISEMRIQVDHYRAAGNSANAEALWNRIR